VGVKIKPLARTSLVDGVVEQIRSVIDQGQLKAGDRLPSESELVRQLCVSRPVLREAIGRLEAMGLVEVQRGRGMFVGGRGSLSNCVKLIRSAMAISPKELIQFYEFRRAVESYTARRAAEQATPADVAELEALYERMDREGQDYEEAIHTDFQFHLKLAEITGNELMRHAMEVIQGYVMAGMIQTTPYPRDRAASRREHVTILDAIRAKDPAAAERAMQAHIDQSEGVLLERFNGRKKAQVEL
jgi:GntR family transcriptional repressor for pyruvate dehydrogenase complex